MKKEKQIFIKNQMSSEQQTRQNEMLKIMLQRPQQLLPQGMVSQNDELKKITI